MSNENIKTWPENIWVDTVGEQLNNIHLDSWYISNESSPLCPDELHYIRADIAAAREKEIILYLLNQYAPKPMGRTCQQTFMGLDVLKVYGEMGLEKLK